MEGKRQSLIMYFRGLNPEAYAGVGAEGNPHLLHLWSSAAGRAAAPLRDFREGKNNLVHLLQSKDRIHRLGLPEGPYTQYYFPNLWYETLAGLWSMDYAVYIRLKEKEQTMLDAIDRHVLETMPTTQEDLDMIFAGLFD